ncbi:MAG TPA: hypothetical protein VL595_03870 [Pseudonocardia sp.]|jgi:hypothetical protein|nr:hypothetical protein [Pseudonocardia sp.]
MDNPLQGWSSTFDGAAEITTAELMTRHPSGSGVARPMRWDFHTEAAGPVWDMYAAREMRNFGGRYFLVGALPGRALHTINIFGMDGSPLSSTA